MSVTSALRKSAFLRGYFFTKNDIIELYNILQEQLREIGQAQANQFILQKNQTLEDLERLKQNFISMFKIYVNIETDRGTTVINDLGNLFSIPDIPARVTRIEFTSANLYREIMKKEPSNQLYFLLDFRKSGSPGIVGAPGQATSNDSQYFVLGENVDWVRSTQSKIEDFLHSRRRKYSWLHSQGIYDILLQIAGVFLIAWFMGLLIPRVDVWFSASDDVYKYASYIFIFLVGIRLFAFMFNYARFIFPVVELKDNYPEMKAHRFICSAIILSASGGFLYDIFREIF